MDTLNVKSLAWQSGGLSQENPPCFKHESTNAARSTCLKFKVFREAVLHVVSCVNQSVLLVHSTELRLINKQPE